jgi:protein-disulfide isomerase
MGQRSDKLERVLSLVLTVCAVVFAVILARRELFGGRAAAASPATEAPVRVSNWSELRSAGLALRAPDAPVVVVEFADLECPACKRFHTRLEAVAAELDTEVGLVMVHFPIATHRFARPAARALECAHAAGAGARFVDLAYAKQDSLGLKSWASYAAEAGVRDTAAFGACARDAAPVERVERGRRLGDAIGVRGTPTVIINGWRFPAVPDDAQLRAALRAAARGEAPRVQ